MKPSIVPEQAVSKCRQTRESNTRTVEFSNLGSSRGSPVTNRFETHRLFSWITVKRETSLGRLLQGIKTDKLTRCKTLLYHFSSYGLLNDFRLTQNSCISIQTLST